MSILSQVLRRLGCFYISKSSHHVVRKPKHPCGKALAENNQDLWLTVAVELPANSQYQLASYVSEPFGKYILQPQLKHPSW